MRPPLRAFLGLIAATFFLGILLVVNIVTGRNSGPPLGPSPAYADFISSDFSSEDVSSLISAYDLGSESSTSSVSSYYTTVAYSGQAQGIGLTCPTLCSQAVSSATALARADLANECNQSGLWYYTTATNVGDCSCVYGGNTATVSVSVTGYCASASSMSFMGLTSSDETSSDFSSIISSLGGSSSFGISSAQ